MFYLLITFLINSNTIMHRPVVKTTPYKVVKQHLIPRKEIKKMNENDLPSSVDLCDKLPDVASQNWQGSCVAWATGYYYKTFQEGKEHNWDLNDKSHICSPAFVYNQVNSGNDDGSFPMDALRLIRTSGCASWSDMPYDPDDNKTLPNKEQQKNALKWRGKNFYFFYGNTGNITSGKRSVPVDDETLKAMKEHLAQGDAFVISIPYYNEFGSLKTNFYTKDHNEVTYLNGGHAMVVCGYDDNIGNGQGGFRVKNSWGTDWGENGLAYLSYEFMKYFSSEALFMNDRINYEPKTIAEIDLTNIPRSQISFMFLGDEGNSPLIDFLRFDFRRDYHQIIDLTDINVETPENYLFNFLDFFEDGNNGILENFKIINYQDDSIIKDYAKDLPITLPDQGDIDIVGKNFKTIHYDKNGYDDSTMGGNENKEGYIGVEIYFKNEGIIHAIDFFTPYNDTDIELYIYNTPDDFLNKKDDFLYSKKSFIKNMGWHTQKLDLRLEVNSRTTKFIIIKYKNEHGSVIPIESFENQNAYSYYSLDGTTLKDLNYGAKIRVRQKLEELNTQESDTTQETSCNYSTYSNKTSFIFYIFLIIMFFIKRRKFIIK